MTTKDLLIIIPAYNEETNIREVLVQLKQPEFVDIADVLVIDDASLDDTGRIAREQGCKLIRHVFNLGYGSALQSGYQYAARRNYKYVIQMDADGQHDVHSVLEIYAALKERTEDGRYPDLVLASRFLEGSSDFPFSLTKRFACGLFRTFIRLATGERIADPTTGFQGLSRRAFCYYTCQDHFDDRYPDANMILQMLLLDFSVIQIPAHMYPRTDGKSMHSGLKPLWYMLRMSVSMLTVLLRIRLLHPKKERSLS